MKVDFIHIGYHKTASTWMQFHGFPAHPDIVMCNDPKTSLDNYFVRNFVETADFFFDTEHFKKNFASMVQKHKGSNNDKIYGISEENISGHFWNGTGSEVLANRVRNVFGDVKIIIVIRNQFDMFFSLYSNYVKSGGTKSLKALMKDINMFGERVVQKLCYHNLIEYYVKLFSADKLLVLCYEDFSRDMNGMMNRIFGFIGVKQITLPDESGIKKLNVRLSAPGELVFRNLNFLGLEARFIRKAISVCESSFTSHIQKKALSRKALIPEHIVSEWRGSNRRLQEYISTDIGGYNYPIV